MTLERTEESYIKRQVDEKPAGFEFGEVVKVYEHTTDSDKSNHEVDIILRDEDHQRRRVPVIQTTKGSLTVPEKGDSVVVGFLRGDTESPIVVGFLPTVENRATKGTAGTIRHKRGSLYTEMDPNGKHARIAKKTDDTATPDAKVEMDDTGAVTIETTGDITISAGGNVTIDEGGTAKRVLTEDAVFEYDDTTINDTSDGSGTSSTTTKKTTKVANGETTQTEVE